LHPDDHEDPYVFRVDLAQFGMGTLRVVFSHEATTGTTAVHLDVFPMSAHKQPASTNPRRWVTGALAVAATAIAARRRHATRHHHGVT
jgi:hypothetical protein